MGKLLDALKAKLGTLGKAHVGSIEDFIKDPQKQYDEIILENSEYFIKKRISEIMSATFTLLPVEKQEEINNKNLPDEQKWQETAEAFEARFGEKESQRLADEITGIVTPDDPSYPDEKRYTNFYKDVIDPLRSEIKPDDPQADEKRKLLDKVEKDLLITSDEARKHYNRLDEYLLNRVNGVMFTDVRNYIDTYEEGKYGPMMPTELASNINLQKYQFDGVDPAKCSFSSRESAELAGKLTVPVSPELKKDVLDITDMMEKHAEGYHVKGSSVFSDKSISGKEYYWSEQGQKEYAFWPLHQAHMDLVNALKTKDFNKIREAEKKFTEAREFSDGMMKIMEKYKSPLCAANSNSTRGGGGKTSVPEEYMRDFTTHSNLNGISLLHSFTKNSGVPVKELLEDPVTAMRKSASVFLEKEGLHNMTLGAKLHNALSPEYASTTRQCFGYTDVSNAGRGLEAIAAMEKDPKKRRQIQGVAALAVASGTIMVAEYTDKVYKLSEMNAAKKDVFYQHAALLPENEFRPLQLGDALQDENWKKNTDPRKLVAKLRKQGKLDFNDLAQRTEKVFQEIEAEMDRFSAANVTKFKADKFVESSLKAYNEVIRTATPDEKRDPAFKAFRNKVWEMSLKNDAKTAERCNKLDANIDLQMQKKSGWFISSNDTLEHDKMVVAQRKLQYKLKQLRGEPINDLPEDELEALKGTDLNKLVNDARRETYEYCRLKTDNGKGGFLHKVGADRYNSAFHSLETINDIAESCGLLSPGQKLMEETKNNLLNERSDRAWARSVAKDSAAKMILGMTMANSKKSFDEQSAYFKEPKLSQSLDKIKADPAFRRMMQNEGAEKMVDNIVLGKTNVTDAYIKAKNQIALETQNGQNLQNAPSADEMTNADKRKMWENDPIKL